MAVISGMAYYKKTDKSMFIDPVPVYKCNIKLPENFKYLVGIDQSSSCTGLFICNKEMTFFSLLEIKNDTGNKEFFYRDLKNLLFSLFNNRDVQLIVHEEPVPNLKQYTSGKILLELKGKLQEWIQDLPSLEKPQLKNLYPQTWKKYVVSKEKAKNCGETFQARSKNKMKIAEDICDIFTFLKEYKKKEYNKDFDGFDATGILLGWLRYSHNENGFPRICGMKEQRHTSLVMYKYVDKSLIKTDPNCIMSQLDYLEFTFRPTFLAFNTEYNKIDNIKMASTNWNCVATILPKKYLEELQWLFSFELDDSKAMLMYVIRKGAFTNKQISNLKEVIEWSQEI